MNLKVNSKRPAITVLTALTVCFIVYSFIASFSSLPPYQWAVVFALLIGSAVVYTLLDRGFINQGPLAILVVVITYAIVALGVFHPTIDNIFRSDYWFIFALFEKMGGFTLQNIKELSVFEFMGDLRFQPLAHILIYIRYAVFQDNIILFHLSNIVLHISAALLIFLVVKEITRATAFSFIFGLLFIVLQSQFDTVVWTYHLYIILGAISFLIVVLLTLKYLSTDKPAYLYIAALFSLVSLLLYEPSILVPALVFLIVYFRNNKDGGKGGKRRLALSGALAFFAYLAFILITLYGMTLIDGEGRVGLGSLLGIENLALAVKGSVLNIWESTLLKNTGVAARIHIFDIVYVYLPDDLYSTLINIVKLALALLLISFFRITRDNRGTLFVLALVALSYIFIISLGRVHSNTITYLLSQPRYQYFVNAAALIITALLVSAKYREKDLKPLIAIIFAALFFWNSHNVLYANNRVDKEMDFLNAPYYKIKAFLAEEPSAIVYVNYAPLNELRFFLGSDIAFDMLFGESVTRFSAKATHIFDGESVKVNEGYRQGSTSLYLEDFKLSWGYLNVKKDGVAVDEYTLVGPEGSYPGVSLDANGHVALRLKEAASGRVETYRLKLPAGLPSDRFAMMEVIKDGEDLCLRVNGVLVDKLPLSSKYVNWELDGSNLLGEYYYGRGGVSYVTMLFITHDGEAVKCF